MCASLIMCWILCWIFSDHRRYCIVHPLYSFIQIFNPNCRYFFRVLKLLGIHRLKQQFCQLFVKSFYKGCVSMLVFCCRSWNISIVFFKQLCHLTFKLTPIITLKYLGIFKITTDATLLDFSVLRALVTLYLDATSTPLNIYLYVFLSKTLWGI